MNPCPINPLVTPAQCGGMYKRALENRHNPEIKKCLLCGQGKHYQGEYQKEHEYLNHLGGCDNCGTEGHTESICIDGKTWHLCGVCRIGVWRARKAGVSWVDVKEEIKERSLGTIIKGRKHTYSFERENKEVSYGTGKCGICGLEMTLSYKLKDGRLVDQWCYNKRRSAITAVMDLKEAEKEIAEAHAMVVQGKGTGPLSWEKERELKRVQNRKEAEKRGFGKVKTKQPVTKQEQYKIVAEYQENKAAKGTFESLEIIPLPMNELREKHKLRMSLTEAVNCVDSPWTDPRIPEFLKFDDKLLEHVTSKANENRQTIIGYIISVLEAA